MTVVNPKSISGINSITMASGSDNLLTIHTTNTTERLRINSSGDVIVGSGVTVSPDGDIFTTGVTTATTFVGALTGNVTGNISGGTVAGSTGTFTGAVTLADDLANGLKIGAGEDLILQHNGTNSFIDNNTGDLYIQTTGSGDDILIESADDITLKVAGSETAIQATGDGAVELYHNNEKKLYTATNGTVINSEGDTTLGVYGGSGGSGYAQLYLNGSGTSNNYVQSDNGLIMWINGANRAKFETDGTFIVQDGDVKINTAGHGIDFSATSDASGMTNELLDDYEEGTWTPTVTAGGSAFSTTNASYVKIGKMVFVSFDLTNNSGGDIASVFGLPFAVLKYAAFNLGWVSNNQQGAQGASDIQGGLITTSTNNLGFRVAGGNNTQNVANNVRFIGSGAYETS